MLTATQSAGLAVALAGEATVSTGTVVEAEAVLTVVPDAGVAVVEVGVERELITTPGVGVDGSAVV